MLNLVRFGSVREYKEGSAYGFIRMEGESSIYFHMVNFSWPEAGEGGVSFNRIEGQARRLDHIPHPGDRIAFIMVQGDKGPVANPWCYAEDYEAALKEHRNWPKPT